MFKKYIYIIKKGGDEDNGSCWLVNGERRW